MIGILSSRALSAATVARFAPALIPPIASRDGSILSDFASEMILRTTNLAHVRDGGAAGGTHKFESGIHILSSGREGILRCQAIFNLNDDDS